MKKYNHIIFDLDGTLTDSKPGILNSAFYALEKMGISDFQEKKLNKLIGLPLQEYFKIIFQFNNIQIDQTVHYFREYYGKKGVYENKVYSGIPELLKGLKGEGKNIYVSTAKYEKYAKVVCEHFGFSPYINDLAGADAKGEHATKTELTSCILKRNNISDLNNAVMIGDKHMDIEAGHNNNIDSIGVSYGFGSMEELHNAKPTYIVDSVADLGKLILE